VANGHWSVNWNYFATSGVNSPPLHALQNGNGAPDGPVGHAGGFPTHSTLELLGGRSFQQWQAQSLIATAAYAFNEGSEPPRLMLRQREHGTFDRSLLDDAGRYGNAVSTTGSNGYVEAANPTR